MINKDYNNHKIIVPWIIAFSLFIETLDITILNNAVPIIANEMKCSPLNLKAALTSYLFSLGIFIPISGYMADRYGTKVILFFGILLFALGSIFCGLSQDLLQLVFARVVQGIGGALMMPVCRLVLFKSFDKSEVMKITNFATIPSLLGPALGPVIGGFIVSYFSWRWIFFVNIPCCMILLFLVFYFTKSFKSEKVINFDFIGFGLLSSIICIIIVSTELFSEGILSFFGLLGLLIVSLLVFLLYVMHEKKIDNPIVKLDLFKVNSFKIMILGSFLSRLGIGGVTFLLPILLQVNLFFSPIVSSVYLLFYPLGMIVAKFFVNVFLKKIGFRKTLFYNTNLIGISLFFFSFIINDIGFFLSVLIIFFNGFFTSIQFSCMNVLTYLELNNKLISNGTSVGATVQQLSMSFGIAFLVILLNYDGADKTNNLVGSESYDLTLMVLSIHLFISSLVFLKLDKDAGAKSIKM